jgi:thioredoxin 1
VFRKSLFFVLSTLLLVMAATFSANWMEARSLPSAYDPGISLAQAFQQADKPLLVEFYADTCGTCRRMAPVMHEAMAGLKERFTLVMVNVEDTQNAAYTEIFQVDELPAVFVFDPRRMKKETVEIARADSAGSLERVILDAAERVARAPLRSPSMRPPAMGGQVGGLGLRSSTAVKQP